MIDVLQEESQTVPLRPGEFVGILVQVSSPWGAFIGRVIRKDDHSIMIKEVCRLSVDGNRFGLTKVELPWLEFLGATMVEPAPPPVAALYRQVMTGIVVTNIMPKATQ